MKGKFLVLAGLLMAVLTGCDTKVTMTVSDLTMTVGETREVTYTLNPVGLFSNGSLELISSNPGGILEIEGMFIEAVKEGTATVKATAANMPGAEKTFTASTNFTVTIEFDGNYVRNGDFEQDLDEWSFAPEGSYTSVIDNPADLPHGGTNAFKLWYDADANETSDPLAVELYQNLTGVPVGAYLFSLWFTGDATSVIMTISHGEDIMATEEFAGFGYHPVPEHSGYVNLGVEVVLEVVLDINVSINVTGPEGVYGFIDDVSFAAGTIEDLLKAPENAESGYVNHIENGTFDDDEEWTVDIVSSLASSHIGVSFTGGQVKPWAHGIAKFKIHQTIDVPAETYNLCISFVGGEFGTASFDANEAYAYVKQGEELSKVDLEPVGWNDGTLIRVELNDIDLEGTVEVGIYLDFDGGSDNWINLDDFALWSFNIPE
ncbi:MAG: hypothetical protein WC399_01820 [Bacilli bacterium]|jgi:hypothetical protein